MKKRSIVFFLLCFLSAAMGAELITVSGFVKDKATKEPVLFANIWVKGTTVGVPTNVDGYFSLDVKVGEMLCFSSTGYFPIEVEIKKSNNPKSFFLEKDVQSLEELIVLPEADFGKELLKKIIKKKKDNAKSIADINDYKTLTNTTIYLVMDSMSNASRFVDTLNMARSEDNDELFYTPIYLSEEACNIVDDFPEQLYSNKDGIFPRLNQTIESIIMQYLVVDLDFYKNQIYIFDRGFTSPLSSNATLYYNIYFNDSTVRGDDTYYNFSFAPKNKFAALFTGHFSVDSENLALSHIEVYFKKDVNVNFVNGFKGKVSYKKQQDGKLFLDMQEVGINLSLTSEKDTAKVYGAQRIDKESAGNWLLNKTTRYSTSITLDPKRAQKWKNQEEFKLENLDDSDYQNVNALKDQPVVKAIDAIGGAVLTSYVNTNWFDVGPIFDIYSRNAIEGHRFSVPLRTNDKLFENFTVGGYAGYGSKSKELKYGANLGWQPFKNDKYVVRLSYSDDYSLIAQDKFLRYIKKNPNTRGNGNFIAALTTRERDPYLKEEKNVELRFEFNADKNFDMEFSPYFTESYSTDKVNFVRQGTTYDSYQSYGATVNFRFAFGQNYDDLYFARVYYLTQVPVINITADVGRVNLPGSTSDDLGAYAHIHGAIQGMYSFGAIAMHYMINAGYLAGDAPYDLLDMPVGSMSWGYAKYRYNLLHHATFAHNVYANSHVEVSGGGIILNHVPVIRRLKLREMVSLKCHYGNTDHSYKGVFDLPDAYDNKMTYPYAELGVGLTNIFKILRIEYVYQVGDYHNQEGIADRSGLRFRAEMSF